ncbi:hypothetical protein GS886_26375 [Rhodococcus hoagii]|nr:hypothetical protein [Prescottella equi]
MPGSPRTRCARERTRALRKEIESWAAGRTVTEVLDLLDAAGLAGSEVWNVQQALGSDQAGYRGVVETFEHPKAGRCRTSGSPSSSVTVRARRCDAAAPRRAPRRDSRRGPLARDSRASPDRSTPSAWETRMAP